MVSCNNDPKPAAEEPAPVATPAPEKEVNVQVEAPKEEPGTSVKVGPGGVDVKVQDRDGNKVEIETDKPK
jgi:hypothetical protein